MEQQKDKVEVVTVRGLPEGTRDAIDALAVKHGRSREGETRYAIKHHLASSTSNVDSGERDSRVVAAERTLVRISTVRDSVRRKLDNGSAAVSPGDVTRWENDVINARLALGEVSPSHPDALLHALL